MGLLPIDIEESQLHKITPDVVAQVQRAIAEKSIMRPNRAGVAWYTEPDPALRTGHQLRLCERSGGRAGFGDRLTGLRLVYR